MEKLSPSTPSEIAAAAERCARELLSSPGRVLLLPTETVYGLACLWTDKAAREKIYNMKRRSDDKPLQMLAADMRTASELGLADDGRASLLADAFCPGPVTIVAPSRDGGKIGFRIPDHPFAKALLLALGQPVAATSANLSGRPAALCHDDAARELALSPDISVDMGPLPSESRASTVVEIFEGGWKILREGPVSEADIRRVLG